jgi:hypothetical protein
MSTITLSHDWPHVPFISQTNDTLLEKLKLFSNAACYIKASSLLQGDAVVSDVLQNCSVIISGSSSPRG